MKEAMFYVQENSDHIRCELCRFRCLIKDGKRGICNVRENRNGTLYSLVYGKLSADHVDPIEKKPLFHVLPGSKSYSIATAGCNFHCRHCQNHTISQPSRYGTIRGMQRTPSDIVKDAQHYNCQSISYTYTEPTIFYELAYDSARIAFEAGLLNIFVTNGYISKKALSTIAPYLAAANIDLKSFSDDFYRDIVHARLSEVLDSIIEHRKQGIWIELTTLIIPGLNDSDAELQAIARFILQNLGPDTPWHVTQFYPIYQMTNRPRTPVETLRRARDIGLAEGLHYVYEGNVPGEGGENTWCPSCKKLLIERYGYTIKANQVRDGKCSDCGTTIPGIGM